MAVDPSTSTGDGDGDGSPSAAAAREIEYRFYCEFQSHDPEFDYLKSLEIEERINKIRWCRARTGPLFLLSTNDKTIKLWKVHEKSGRVVTSRNVDPSQPAAAQRAPFLSGPSAVVMPTLQPMQPMVTATLKRTYGNGHAYHINSLSFNADGETYLSADDLRIHIWNLNTAQQAYNIADLKPADMEELSEVIMAAEFHPTDCAALAYCSSKGVLRLADLRERALCDAKGGCRTFRPQADAEASSFFSEVVSSMTDVKFSRDGRRLMTRDYMTVKVWDVAMEREPLRTIKVRTRSRAQSSIWCLHLSLTPRPTTTSGARAPALEAHRPVRERPHLRQVRGDVERRRAPRRPPPFLPLPPSPPLPSPLAAGPFGVLGFVRFEAAHLGRVRSRRRRRGHPRPHHTRSDDGVAAALGVQGVGRRRAQGQPLGQLQQEGPHARPPALPPPPGSDASSVPPPRLALRCCTTRTTRSATWWRSARRTRCTSSRRRPTARRPPRRESAARAAAAAPPTERCAQAGVCCRPRGRRPRRAGRRRPFPDPDPIFHASCILRTLLAINARGRRRPFRAARRRAGA